MKRLSWFLLPACALALACSGGSEGGDPGGGPDVPDAVVGDEGADPGPVDPGTPDPGLEDPGYADPGEEDVAADVPVDANPGDVLTRLPDIDWQSLPTLPAGKTFTTRYAAGVGRVDVTPATPTYLSGFGFCLGTPDLCRSAAPAHDPLYASAVALADTQTGELVVFVGVDMIGLFPYDGDVIQAQTQIRMAEELGIYFQGERIMPSGSHAHSTPDTTGLWGPLAGAGRDDVYVKQLIDGIVESAVLAVKDLQDVTLDWGKGTSPNSDEDGIVVDEDLFVIRGKTPEGVVRFTMTRWPGHPTTYGSDNLSVSADWPGTFRVKMEAELGGMAIHLQGPIGSVYPDRPGECGLTEEAFPDGYKHPDVSDADRMKVTCTGFQVANNALAALENAQPVAETGIRFRQMEYGIHVNNGTFDLLRDFGPLNLPYFDTEDPNSVIPEESEWVTLGDLNFLTTPGESFPAFGAAGAKILTDAGYTNPIVLGLTPNWIGYLLLEEQWKNIDLSYHQSLSPGPDIDKKFRAAVQAAVDAEAAAK